MGEIMHKIGDDGWPAAIWQGVNEQKITLHLGRDHHQTIGYVDVKTADGTVRGYVGDILIRNSGGEFYVLRKPLLIA